MDFCVCYPLIVSIKAIIKRWISDGLLKVVTQTGENRNPKKYIELAQVLMICVSCVVCVSLTRTPLRQCVSPPSLGTAALERSNLLEGIKMDDVAPLIAYVRFVDKKNYPTQLETICCPYCDGVHLHGSGGKEGPDFGHRAAHCGNSLGYYLRLPKFSGTSL